MDGKSGRSPSPLPQLLERRSELIAKAYAYDRETSSDVEKGEA